MVFKQIFRVPFVALIWKQYKGFIISTVLLLAYILLVGSIHSDFITHSQLQENKSVSGLSFVLKWLAYGVGIAIYFGFHAIRGSLTQKEDLPEKARQANKDAKLDQDDPFAAIRAKESLRSRADFIEQKKK